MDKPLFRHDCDNCQFLGNFQEHDLYVHRHRTSDTVVARYGSEGPEYLSCPSNMIRIENILFEAVIRSHEMFTKT